MILATTNAKGGVGKSTLAVHLAVWLQEQGLTVTLVDADVQRSSSRWLQEAEPAMNVVRVMNPDDVRPTLKKLRRETHVIVVDGPAGLNDVTLRILLMADVALVPCGPSLLDLEASQLAVHVIKEAQESRGNGLPMAVFIANKVQLHTRLSQELLETARNIGIPMAQTPIRLRQVYADCRGQGTTVFKMGYRAREAADDLRALFTEVFKYGRTQTDGD
jgi:chromosome partitioning protein